MIDDLALVGFAIGMLLAARIDDPVALDAWAMEIEAELWWVA